MRKSDAIEISFYGGGSLIMMVFSFFFLIVVQKNLNQDDFYSLYLPLKIFRTTFIPIYIIFASGFAV